jgi:hypothetical protein
MMRRKNLQLLLNSYNEMWVDVSAALLAWYDDFCANGYSIMRVHETADKIVEGFCDAVERELRIDIGSHSEREAKDAVADLIVALNLSRPTIADATTVVLRFLASRFCPGKIITKAHPRRVVATRGAVR